MERGHSRRRRITRAFYLQLLVSAVPLLAQEPVDPPQEVRDLVKAGRLGEALERTSAWLEKYPADLDARAWHARILRWQGRAREAEGELRALMDAHPDHPELFLIDLARVLNARKAHDAALGLLDRACRKAAGTSDCQLERARTLALLGRTGEAHGAYRDMLQSGAASDSAKAARAELAELRRHEFRFGGIGDLLNYASDGGSLTASLDSHWTTRWQTVATVTRYSRFGLSATGAEASATYRLPGLGGITVGGGSGGNSGIAPRAQALLGFDRGFPFTPSGPVRGFEAVYQQRWVWYPEARILSFAPGGVFYFPRSWTCFVRMTLARVDSGGAPRTWHTSGQARLSFPVGRRFTAQVLVATGSENFGTVDQLLFRSSKLAGGGLNIRLRPGQEFGAFVHRLRLPGGRSQQSVGGAYAVRF